jgi:hypothetical protein
MRVARWYLLSFCTRMHVISGCRDRRFVRPHAPVSAHLHFGADEPEAQIDVHSSALIVSSLVLTKASFRWGQAWPPSAADCHL